ncbi:MAG: tetratricopeptide repeat protein [Bacteroidales bacterium]|nr:tetratricopeptide repeat protein [Bacteroidales bacterium]
MLSSCSTKKNTLTRRAYHNLVAHYNTYWNGSESFERGVQELKSKSKTNYTDILPIEYYGTRQEASAINSYMDRAIEKGSKVIQKHSMVFARKERVKRIPDSYLLVGKAYFYKQDYINAQQTFEFIMRNYERQPFSYFGQVWLARTHIRLREFEKSITLLDGLQEQARKRKVPEEVVAELPMVYAWHFAEQQNHNAAIPHLRKAIELSKDKIMIARTHFILGQIYERQGNYGQATQYYNKVIKSKPNYELAFNARINLAQCYDASRANSSAIVREMNKMLKETKNKEYRDQIYYALATIAMRENNDSMAARLLRRSVASSVTNDIQKSLSAQALAELYFKMPRYPDAYAYYDTTLQTLSSEHPHYKEVELRTNTLAQLVENLNIIAEQDSLQRLAAMSASERDKIINKIIENYRAEQAKLEQERKAEESLVQGGYMNIGRDPTMSLTGRTSGGEWYFYNTQTITYGIAEFQRKWGKRKLEDNWRLSDKRTYNFDLMDDMMASNDTTESKDGSKVAADPLKKETYLQNIPLTPEQIEASDELIANAMYKVGYVFRDGLKNYPRSADAFEAYLKKYPQHEHELNAFYHLYTLYTILSEFERAEFYKNLIINRYPDSEYALGLSNPNYYTNLQTEQNRLKSLYNDTYLAFTSNQHRMVVLYSNEAMASYPNSELTPKFAYLRAVSMGKMYNNDTLVQELRRLISRFPSSNMVPLAQEVMGHLGIEGFDAIATTEEPEDPATSIYSTNDKVNHFFIVIVNYTIVNVDATRVKISDFNSSNYKLSNLTINAVLLDNDNQVISVSNFNGKNNAMAYFSAITQNEYVFSHLKPDQYHAFVISADNYPVFYRDKNIETYKKYFSRHYLK